MSIENAHTELPESDDALVDDEGKVVKFDNEFTCLGSIINFALEDTVDAESRMSKDSKAIGVLRFI